jgi:hypothetical protein
MQPSARAGWWRAFVRDYDDSVTGVKSCWETIGWETAGFALLCKIRMPALKACAF